MAAPLGRIIEYADGRRSVVLDLSIDTTAFEAAMQRLAQALSRFSVTTRRPGLRRVDAHHPRPLCIDGHAYRRRTRARARRNR